MLDVDARFVQAEVINGEIVFDGTYDGLPHPTVCLDGCMPAAPVADGLDAVTVALGTRPLDALGEHGNIQVPVWDIGVEGEHEFVANGIVVHNCYKEVLQSDTNPQGWMDPQFIERKKASVPAEMFRVEYELGEPSGTARAFDLQSINDAITITDPIQHTHKPNDRVWVYAKPDPTGIYATGADWAKQEDETVITTWRTDTWPHQLAYLRIIKRRPWPEMIRAFNTVTKAYQGTSAHDATGIGNVVADHIDEQTINVVMVGRDRIKLLTDYIAAVEQGTYEFPHSAQDFIAAHKNTTVDAIYRPTASGAHLPDIVASSALAHRAATRGGVPASPVDVLKLRDITPMPHWMEPIDNPPAPQRTERIAGEVVMVEDPDDDVAVFYLE